MSNLKIAHSNTRSLLKNYLAFTSYFDNFNFDIVALSETWLSTDIPNDLIMFQNNYNIVRKDRSDRGGGVAVFYKNNLRVEKLNLDVIVTTFEYIAIKITIKRYVFIFVALYRPSSLRDYIAFLSEFEIVYSQLLSLSNEIICMGDINFDLLNLEKPGVKQYLDLLNFFSIYQLIDEPTRVTATSRTLLDHLLTTNANLIKSFSVDHNHTISDHAIISTELNVIHPVQLPKSIEYRAFNSLIIDDFTVDLLNIDWNYLYRISDINKKKSYFNEKIVGLFNKHAAWKTSRITKKPAPWLTENLKIMMKLRDNALKRYRVSKMVTHWDYYKSLRNLVNKTITLEKRAYLEFKIKNK